LPWRHAMKVSRRFKQLLAAMSLEEKTHAVVNFARRIAEVNEGEVAMLHAVPTQSHRLHRPIYRPAKAGGATEAHAEAVARQDARGACQAASRPRALASDDAARVQFCERNSRGAARARRGSDRRVEVDRE